MDDATKCLHHEAIRAEMETLKVSDEKQWKAIDEIKNRLPVWATIIISVLTFLLGLTVTYKR